MSNQYSGFNEERARQIAEARRMADGDEVMNPISPRNPRGTISIPGKKIIKPATAPQKGHEAFLKALEASGTKIKIEKVSSGDKITGRIKTSDKYTISLACDLPDGRYVTRVIFKHDISEFTPIINLDTVAPAATAETVH